MGIDKIVLTAQEKKGCAEDQLLIEPHCSALNFRDILVAMGLYPGKNLSLGGDVAGVVREVGAKITQYQPGDEVFGFALDALSSQAITTPQLVAIKPKNFDFAQAAAMPTVFLTAYHCLVATANLQAGQTVLIHTASGGVGLAAIQVAKRVNATIIATAGSDEKRDYLRQLGVDYVFDSRSLTFAQEIARVTQDKGVGVILRRRFYRSQFEL